MKTLFETVTGSRGYGLALENSDTDVLRVVSHDLEHYFGLKPYKEAQHLKGEEDTVVYDLRFFANTLLKGSFNTLLPLFFERSLYRHVDSSFECFLNYRHCFVTDNTVRCFYGFGHRMYKEFSETGNFKSAANGLFVLNALNNLCEVGFVGDGNREFLRNVKLGNVESEEVQLHFKNALKLYSPENMTGCPFVHSQKFTEQLASRLCVEVLSAK